MAPAPPGSAILFHPKAKKKQLGTAESRETSSSGSVSPKRPRPVGRPRPPKPEAEKEDAAPALPEGPYTEFNLVSSALNGWKYDVMKFDSRKPVDILRWQAPVKLNRKELRRPETTATDEDLQAKAVGPMLGPDGKPVIGMDGRMVMVDAEGKPIHPRDSTPGSESQKKGPATKKKFQKKTRQVFKIPEATRQLRKEERYPWVMEDATGGEIWQGKMEEVVKAETHAFFMPASNNTFKFVPAHRWYKFHKRPNYHIPDLEEAESLMAMRQKNKDPERWLLHKRNGQGPSAATSALFKAESGGEPVLGGGPSSQRSLGPGGRRLRTVVNGSDSLFGDEDEGEGPRRRKREYGAEADFDEVPYQEEFADDEEKMVQEDEEDEVAKEMEERLQREYMSANKQRDSHVDEDVDEEESQLTGAGKAIKKLMSKLEKNEAYEDDEEENPYASSEEEEEEEEIVSNEPAVQSYLTPSQTSRAASPSQPSQPAAPPRPEGASSPSSRATSPVPNHGGHFVVAKRATSPKAPKPKAMGVNGSRATSPLAQQDGPSGRATSPPSAAKPPSAVTPNGT
ncbi:hypothetical protein EWM64_g4145, partial [Hericium alpestre]